MKYINQPAEWNNKFYNYIDYIVKNYNNPLKKDIFTLPYEYIKKYFIDNPIDLNNIIYKKLIDEEEKVEIDGKSIKLLPMGLVNNNIKREFIGQDNQQLDFSKLRRGTLDRCLSEPSYHVFYYPNDILNPDFSLFDRVCKSYINHYQKSLGEEWQEKNFYDMIKDLKYLSVKYAKDEETKEIFAIGFFGAYLRNGSEGPCLTNAELYVMPEFRKMGIAKKLVGLTFDEALKTGIKGFDSITYRVIGNDALSFWESIGASVTGLIHIEGNINEMGKIIEEKTNYRTK